MKLSEAITPDNLCHRHLAENAAGQDVKSNQHDVVKRCLLGHINHMIPAKEDNFNVKSLIYDHINCSMTDLSERGYDAVQKALKELDL
jgi:hypothetical protein